MYEASFLFHSIWKVVSPFIDAATKAKIKFIGREGVAELQSVIGPAVSCVWLLVHQKDPQAALYGRCKSLPCVLRQPDPDVGLLSKAASSY